MTSKARAEYDPTMMGVRIAVTRDLGGGRRAYLQWPRFLDVKIYDPAIGAAADDDAWLRMEDEDARALYEALADHFGHAGHDIRALRKDYDAERGRVDRLITHLTGGKP